MILTTYVIPLLVIVIAFLVLIIALIQLSEAEHCKAISTAEVTKMGVKTVLKKEKFTEEVKNVYYPTFKYTVEDVEYVRKSFVGTYERHEIGEEVKIAYDKNNPTSAILYETITSIESNCFAVILIDAIFIIIYATRYFTSIFHG